PARLDIPDEEEIHVGGKPDQARVLAEPCRERLRGRSGYRQLGFEQIDSVGMARTIYQGIEPTPDRPFAAMLIQQQLLENDPRLALHRLDIEFLIEAGYGKQMERLRCVSGQKRRVPFQLSGSSRGVAVLNERPTLPLQRLG